MSDTARLPMLPSAVSRADHVGQGTTIEQARAGTEVLALVTVAQQRPRSVAAATAEMEEIFQQEFFIQKAFYDYPRGKGADKVQITDLSIIAVKELARCWGNIQYGSTELRQDRSRNESEMEAWAWDMQSNQRVVRRVVVPHVRDTTSGSKTLTDVRDVYELLQNHTSRRLRECIKDVLPSWFVERARKVLWQALEHGGGVSLQERRIVLTKLFRDKHNVTVTQLETKLDRKLDDWTALDLAKLKVTHESLTDGIITRDEAFPPIRITPDTLPDKETVTALAAENAAAAAHVGLLAKITAQLDRLEINSEQYDETIRLLTLGEATALLDLTPGLATMVHNRLGSILDTAEPGNEIDAVLGAARDEIAGQDTT